MDIRGKIAVVTGGASGMGFACVRYLISQGAEVVVWDKVISQNNQNDIHQLVCDVSSSDDVERAMKNTLDQVGIPKICINCAGIAPAKRIIGKEGAMSLESFNQVIQVNLVGTFNVMRVVSEQMSKSSQNNNQESQGVIINTASIAAYEGQIGQAAYSASKGGIVSLTLPAARELAQFGIRVNAIAPGLIATPLLLNMSEEIQESLAKTIPYPKRLGKPEEFAALVGHMIQNEMINGEVIRLDGALRMQPR